MKKLFLSLLFVAFGCSLFSQIEKPKGTTTTKTTTAKTTSTPGQAIVVISWSGTETVIIHVGDKNISLAGNEQGQVTVTPGAALTIKVEKPGQVYSYPQFMKFNAGKNYINIEIINGIVSIKSETELQRQYRIEGITRIGTQSWSSKNLDVSVFRNGDAIPEAQTDAEWKKAAEAGKAAWCYYKEEPGNGILYGKLYNWYAVNDARGLAPKGWHVATDAEWTQLTNYLGEAANAATKMKATTGWNQGGNGTNESKFEAFPGGYRGKTGFFQIGDNGYWWTATECKTFAPSSFCRFIYYYGDGVKSDTYLKENGLSVRCIKN